MALVPSTYIVTPQGVERYKIALLGAVNALPWFEPLIDILNSVLT